MRIILKSLLIFILLSLLGALPAYSKSETKASHSKPSEIAGLISSKEGFPVIIWNREIVTLRRSVEDATAQARAEEIKKRILDLPKVAPKWNIVTVDASLENKPIKAVYVNGTFLFALHFDDVDPALGKSLEETAQEAINNLREFRKRGPNSIVCPC